MKKGKEGSAMEERSESLSEAMREGDLKAVHHQEHARSKGASAEDHQAHAMGFAGGGAVCYDKDCEAMCSGGKVK